jgi:hypothetical protein
MTVQRKSAKQREAIKEAAQEKLQRITLKQRKQLNRLTENRKKDKNAET